MDKRLRNIIIIVIAMAILIVAFIAVDTAKKKEEDKEANSTEQEETYKLVTLESSDVRKITFKTEKTNLVFVYDEEKENWSCEGKTWPLNQEMVATILSETASVVSNRKLENAAEISEYGLDKPQLEVTLDTKDTGSYSFVIGDKMLAQSCNYFMMKDGENVYTVDTALMTAFDYNENQFIQVEEIAELDSNNVYYVDVNSKEEDDFSFYYDGDKTDTTVAKDWYITKPYDVEQFGKESNVYSYTSNLASLAYDECIEYKAKDLSKYGLDKPAYTLNFKYYTEEDVAKEDTDEESDDAESEDTETETVIKHFNVTYLIGDGIKGTITDEETGEESEGIVSYYVKSTTTDSVYTWAADVVDVLCKSEPMDVVETVINPTDVLGYSSVVITSGSDKYTIVKKEKATKDEDGEEVIENTYKLNSKTLKTKEGDELCYAISGLNYSRPISAAAESKKEVASIKFNAGTDTTDMIVKFYTYTDSFYSVERDGGEYFLIEKNDVDALLKDLAELSKTE